MTATSLRGFAAVPLDELRLSPSNPRQTIGDVEELAHSIRENGLIQPLIVQRVPDTDGFQIVAGHRRYAAVKLLDWATVPCIIRKPMRPDAELLAMLVENGQRTDLDPVEEARALARLRDDGHTLQAIGRRIGRSQFHVHNRLKLLALDVNRQEELRAGALTLTSALDQAKLASGHTRKRSKPADRAWHFAHTHPLAGLARARCTRLGHKQGRKVSGGEACGECWESVIRADERQSLHTQSNTRGRCVLCDTAQTDGAA